ncbi:inactive ubiquitin carboxyl-terminal hydrolase MINDY-4B isoform X1 [Acipenser ruthenus]|uniref:inactive ubiquitin carboxyl-terminal hydrolase MINDY-4B isoform X1 n=2 Tax=Acipenser ruthenus TaxID=7906 RepID=UPI002741712E|nr:inactive ubiquitin carboxyl-terminal hydrolase MINDY-4B isoform X1 [Acipenser ruthenus]
MLTLAASDLYLLQMEQDINCKKYEFNSEELDEIASKISDLDKWRGIFSSQVLELNDASSKKQKQQESRKSEDESEDGTGATSGTKSHGQVANFNVLYSIPKPLTISSSLGGIPITMDMAGNLRKILFGSTFHIFNYEWKKSYFKFREPFSDLSYALEAERGGSSAIQMAVQANIIRYLLFTGNNGTERVCLQYLYDVSPKKQEEALAAALSDILWSAGESQSGSVCLVSTDSYFTPSTEYKVDNFTERVQLFKFSEKETMQKFIYDHIQCFKEEGSHGVILFLYSLIFSRTIDRLREDLDSTTPHLLLSSLGNFVCRQALLNLMLTGRASPNVFNGNIQYDDQGSPLPVPLHGVLIRSDVGYLHWNRELLQRGKLPMVGSMLKTPKLPIWLCNINATYSVLFSTNRSLLSDWKMEHLFDLYLYSGQPAQNHTVILTIDTHSHHWEEGHGKGEGDLEKRFPSVEMTIRTKWEGAAIDWNGTVPFF